MTKTTEQEENKVAALIYFADGVTQARAMAWIKKLEEQGHVEGFTCREYNPDHGSPVWYIP